MNWIWKEIKNNSTWFGNGVWNWGRINFNGNWSYLNWNWVNLNGNGNLNGIDGNGDWELNSLALDYFQNKLF